MNRDCAQCRDYLERDRPNPRLEIKRSYAVPVCLHPKIRNNHGVLACKAARAADGKCAPDGQLWTPRRS